MRLRLLILHTLLVCCTAFAPARKPASTCSPRTTRRETTTQCNLVPVRVLGVVSLFGLASSLKVVNQGNVAIVERLGKFTQILNPGLHVLIPIVDRLRTTISKREQVFDIPPQKCITLDNAPLAADAVVYWRVINAERSFYSVIDLQMAIQNLVLTQLRSEIGKLTLDATFSAREQINSVLLEELDVATEPWGVKITRIEVRDIIPNKDIMKAMELQMAAERTKRAVIIKSEGDLARAVNEAEGDAQARIIDAKAGAEAIKLQAQAQLSKLELEAQGAAKAIMAIETALGSKQEAARFQLVREYIDAQRALATSNNAKVILSPDNGANDMLVKAMALYDGPTSNNKTGQ
jgi:regulator of protease activity HflC (stomatin/prohibitin superfamily)